MSHEVKVAILGMGNMGRAHANQLRKLEGVRIVALCSRTLESVYDYNHSTSADYPAYDDFSRMLASEDFDALYICLPPFAHNGQLEAAVRRGIHVFIEKPIALNTQRGRSMVDAVHASGVRSQVGYHMRFGGAVQRLKKLIDAGETGRPTLYTANYECNSHHSSWWMNHEMSGGQILEQIIHLYDLALYMVGGADRVSAFVSNLCHTSVPGYWSAPSLCTNM